MSGGMSYYSKAENKTKTTEEKLEKLSLPRKAEEEEVGWGKKPSKVKILALNCQTCQNAPRVGAFLAG